MNLNFYRFVAAVCAVVFIHSTLSKVYADDPAQKLVIIHTNDTHSRIDPESDGTGGVARRQVVIDSLRSVYPNLMLVDAGDALQGSLYYTLFSGQVERALMNELGYDIQILGNHEFDGGMENLHRYAATSGAVNISTNYDFTATALDTIIRPYIVKEFNGRKVGFIAINLDPDGIIFAGSSKGVIYIDGLKAANATAWHLKHNEKVDLIVALTHIGYSLDYALSDVELASKSEDIDIIIGGHSHTLINPADPKSVPSRITNQVGDTVLIAQAGYGGKNVGMITIDLPTLKSSSALIPVDSRLDDRLSPRTVAIIDGFRDRVDSILAVKIHHTPVDLKKSDWTLVNLIADIIAEEGGQLVGKKVDMAIMNKGGLRCDIPAGDITEGKIMEMLPFDNKIVVMEISGKDLLDAFDSMARRRGEGISKTAFAPIDSSQRKCSDVTVGGKPVDPDRTYLVATVDYVATGGDYMTPLKNGLIIARSSDILYKDIIRHLNKNFKAGKKLKADKKVRMPLVKE